MTRKDCAVLIAAGCAAVALHCAFSGVGWGLTFFGSSQILARVGILLLFLFSLSLYLNVQKKKKSQMRAIIDAMNAAVPP